MDYIAISSATDGSARGTQLRLLWLNLDCQWSDFVHPNAVNVQDWRASAVKAGKPRAESQRVAVRFMVVEKRNEEGKAEPDDHGVVLFSHNLEFRGGTAPPAVLGTSQEASDRALPFASRMVSTNLLCASLQTTDV